MTTRTCPNCQKPTMQIAVVEDEERWTCKACGCDDGEVYSNHAWLGAVVFAGVAVVVGASVVALFLKAVP